MKSWDCKGCTNICYRYTPSMGTNAYCKPMYIGQHRTKWVADAVCCMDYTADPNATEAEIKVHKDYRKG